MYNPINDRINNLMNQKQMIESQLQNIQQLANIPPININNQITPNMALNDFNGNWGNNGNLQNDALMNQEFIKRDLFNTNQNVSSQGYQNSRDILESRYTTQLGLQNLGQQNQECCCATQRAIDGVNAQSFKNTCDITTAIHSEAEATRALINANTMQELRDKLADRDRELLTTNFQLSQQAQSANIINTLQPTPKPAYITCSPYYAYNMTGCGCNQI